MAARSRASGRAVASHECKDNDLNEVHHDMLTHVIINNLDVAGQRKTIVRKAAQFITQPLFFHESFFASNSSGEVRRNKERKKEKAAQLHM